MGYKMKGSQFFGKGKSPLKVKDSDLVKAQSKLDHVEHDFREPGWAKVAGKIHGDAMGVVKGAADAVAGGGGGSPEGNEKTKGTVADIMKDKENFDIPVD